MRCQGNQDDHCCYVNGQVCAFLEEHTVPGRRWACGLRRELGSWEAVYQDARYQEKVQPMWDTLAPGKGCGDWPLNRCEVCGAVNA